MKHPVLTLTRSRQIGAVCWAVILLAQLCAFHFPIGGLALPLKVGLTALLLVAVAAILLTTLGVWTEKGDERAAENQRKTNATISSLLFLVMAFLLFYLEDGAVLTITREWVLILFAGVCLAQDVLFLFYERFGR